MDKLFENYNTLWTDDSIRIINTPGMTAKSTFFYVQEAGYFKALNGYHTERANLASYLVVYTVSGTGTLIYDGKTYTVSPGSVFYIDCMKHHTYRWSRNQAGGKDWCFYWIHFSGATSDGYYREFARGQKPLIESAGDTNIPIILGEIVESNQMQRNNTELINSRLIVDLITEIITLGNTDHQDQPISELIYQVLHYLEKHFDQPISLDGLSEKFSVSKYHLSREFKKYTGYSPGEYLIRYRINRAKELLKNTEMPISDIGEMTGIQNYNHFCYLFKSRTDMSPRMFREKWRDAH